MTADALARATKGFEWFDKMWPDHVERIDPRRLEVSHDLRCPLGLVSGFSYWEAIDTYRLSGEFIVSHGFTARDGDWASRYDDFVYLQRAWVYLYETAQGLREADRAKALTQ